MNYSNEEQTDMHFCYGLANGVSLQARRLYGERFPRRRLPDARTFDSVHRRLRANGSFHTQNHADAGRNNPAGNIDLVGYVLDRVRRDPDISTRHLATELQVSHMRIWRILHTNGLYPYHLQRVQALYANDREPRLEFCNWLLDEPGHGMENFAWNVLFSDESQFTRDGINNFHNTHLWDVENPYGIIEAGHQQRFSVNVWAGLVGEHLLGPVFLPPRLNGHSYSNFLPNDLPNLLENVPIATRQNMWFMHDGAPPHFSLEARAVLNRPNYFPGRWIGRGGPIPWPPRSPDLNPLDFFVWGHISALVYHRPVNNVVELRARIDRAFDDTRAMPGVFRRTNASFYRRIEGCIMANGAHFEQFL